MPRREVPTTKRRPLSSRFTTTFFRRIRPRLKKPVARGKPQTLPHVVAADIVSFLERKPKVYNEKTGEWRKVHPGDLAVLVRSNKQAAAIHEAIQMVNLPAVIAQVGDVFKALKQKRSLWLAAIARPNSDIQAKRFVTSELFQWTARDLQDSDGTHWENWIGLLSSWQKTLPPRDSCAPFGASWIRNGVLRQTRSIATRLLFWWAAATSLTNLYHLAELLHDATNGRLGSKVSSPGWSSNGPKNTKTTKPWRLRLETDAQAVQISTMHKSKGLQYPLCGRPTSGTATSLCRGTCHVGGTGSRLHRGHQTNPQHSNQLGV